MISLTIRIPNNTYLIVNQFEQNACKFEATNLRIDRRAAGNMDFTLGRVTCKLAALYFYSNSVLVGSSVLRNPPKHKARKSYAALRQCERPRSYPFIYKLPALPLPK